MPEVICSESGCKATTMLELEEYPEDPEKVLGATIDDGWTVDNDAGHLGFYCPAHKRGD